MRLEVVADASEVRLWNEYVERFHPLGYKGAFGYRLRYFIRSGSQCLGCVLLAGAAKAIAVRDRWIGWNERARLRNLPWIIDNSRFPIFPHVQILHLASHVLGQLARRVSADWERQWGFAPLLMFVFQFASRREVNREMTPSVGQPVPKEATTTLSISALRPPPCPTARRSTLAALAEPFRQSGVSS